MTAEGIDAPGSMPRAVQDGSRFMLDPATGTLQIRPEYRDKAAKALMREVRRMKFRLKLQLLRLYFRKFALDLRSMILMGEGYFVSIRNKLSGEKRPSVHLPFRNLEENMRQIRVSVKSGIFATIVHAL